MGCDCQARFDRVHEHPQRTMADQLCAALLQMVAVRRAARCGCLANHVKGPSTVDIVALCAAATAERRTATICSSAAQS